MNLRPRSRYPVRCVWKDAGHDPSSPLNVPTELLRDRAVHSFPAPMAGSRDRLWAALVCTAFVGLSIALIIALR